MFEIQNGTSTKKQWTSSRKASISIPTKKEILKEKNKRNNIKILRSEQQFEKYRQNITIHRSEQKHRYVKYEIPKGISTKKTSESFEQNNNFEKC